MQLTNFLKDNIAYLNDTELNQYKNLSCQSGGHNIFVNYEFDEMFLQSIRPSHANVQSIVALKPAFSFKGRTQGSYCAACGEVVLRPNSIDNCGYYEFSIGIDGTPDTKDTNIEVNNSNSIHYATLNKTWQALLNDGNVALDESNNCILKTMPEIKKAYCALVIPDSIGIQENGFCNLTTLYAVSLPNTLTSIKKGIFNNCAYLTHIEFRGTVAQWHSIIKEDGWNINTGNYKIQCIDGILEKVSTFDWEEFITAIHSYENKKHIFTIASKDFDLSNSTPNIIKLNCKFIESYHYGDSIEFNIRGANKSINTIQTNTGDILLNDCFVKDTIGNFYIELEFEFTEGRKTGIEKINTVTFIPSYYLMTHEN